MSVNMFDETKSRNVSMKWALGSFTSNGTRTGGQAGGQGPYGPKRGKGDKEKQSTCVTVPGYYFALIMSSVYKHFISCSMHSTNNWYFAIVSCERRNRKDVSSQWAKWGFRKVEVILQGIWGSNVNFPVQLMSPLNTGSGFGVVVILDAPTSLCPFHHSATPPCSAVMAGWVGPKRFMTQNWHFSIVSPNHFYWEQAGKLANCVLIKLLCLFPFPFLLSGKQAGNDMFVCLFLILRTSINRRWNFPLHLLTL